MPEDERERIRRESREHLDALRPDPTMPERAFRLYELILDRLDRLETGSFTSEERPTEPDRTRKSSGSIPAFRRAMAELEKGKSTEKKSDD
jgi:hypothetical protein